MKPSNTIAAIGNFDGVHRGHQTLLRSTKNLADAAGGRPGVVLFEPHPRRYFRPDDPPFLLTTPAHRDALLRAAGAENISALTFNAALAALSPEAFIAEKLVGALNLRGVVAGADFRFGAGRAGDSDLLRKVGEAHGLAVSIIDLLADATGAEKFGSSGVRAALKAGDLARAQSILGRDWSITGTVIEGQRLGATLGFPTANLPLGDIIEPRRGVYVTEVILRGARYRAISNVGRRPTVGSDAPLLESHLLDFEGDLYGGEIEVVFKAFMRDERKFPDLDALRAQISIDCAAAKAYFSA